MKKAVAYLRVSTDSQVHEGISLEVQKEKIVAWAKAHDQSLICIEEDAGISGKLIKNREGLKRAIEIACDQKAILVVTSLSRLSRSTRDTLMVVEKLGRAGADLVSLSEQINTSSATGAMLFRMLAVLNEFERDQISERTSAILQHKKAKREPYSPTPFGFSRKGNQLIEDREEQDIVRRINKLREEGCSLREIAGSLNEDGILAKNGGKWYASTIRYLLYNPLHETTLAEVSDNEDIPKT